MSDPGEVSECKSCGAEIRWMKTRNDKNIPVDVPPHEDPERDVILQATLYDKQNMKTHFETCPNATSYRGKPSNSSGKNPPATESVWDGSILAKKLNIAIATLQDLQNKPPDGLRAQELAKVALQQIRGVR